MRKMTEVGQPKGSVKRCEKINYLPNKKTSE